MSHRLPLVSVLVAVCALLAAASARADGGPAPGVAFAAPRQPWPGLAAPAGDLQYIAQPGRRTTLVGIRRGATGRILRSVSLTGLFGVPLVTFRQNDVGGLSHDGRTLVLENLRSVVGLQLESRFAVLEARSLRLRSTVVLGGDFSFDALSPDGATLYLIEHISSPDTLRYRVRAYDLRTLRLSPRIVADRATWETAMTGQPVTRATSRDGRWVYTLYSPTGRKPFVHALDTVTATAVCIDLPGQTWGNEIWNLRLAAEDSGGFSLRREDGSRVSGIDENRLPHPGSGGSVRPVALGGASLGGLAFAAAAILASRRRRRRRHEPDPPAQSASA